MLTGFLTELNEKVLPYPAFQTIWLNSYAEHDMHEGLESCDIQEPVFPFAMCGKVVGRSRERSCPKGRTQCLRKTWKTNDTLNSYRPSSRKGRLKAEEATSVHAQDLPAWRPHRT